MGYERRLYRNGRDCLGLYPANGVAMTSRERVEEIRDILENGRPLLHYTEHWSAVVKKMENESRDLLAFIDAQARVVEAARAATAFTDPICFTPGKEILVGATGEQLEPLRQALRALDDDQRGPRSGES